MTISNHWPYNLNEEKRPHVISSTSKIPAVKNYVNSIWYTSKEVINAKEIIHKNDPDAIIIICGDHLPNLGYNWEGYIESNLVTQSGAYQDNLYTLLRVPLIIIDGKNGPVNTGIVSMYEVPSIILSLLKYRKSSLMQVFRREDKTHVRPFEYCGVRATINIYNQKAITCKPDSTSRSCLKNEKWLKYGHALSTDMFIGGQYSLESFK